MLRVGSALLCTAVDYHLDAFDPFEALLELIEILVREFAGNDIVDHSLPLEAFRATLHSVRSMIVPKRLERKMEGDRCACARLVGGLPDDYRARTPPGGAMAERDRLNVPRRRPLGGYVRVVLTLVVLMAVAVAVGIYVTRDRELVAPALLGMNLMEAEAVAERSGVGLIVVDPEDPASMVASAGPVTVQDPLPGAIMKRGDLIAVSLAAPAAEIVVPEVVGVTRGEAEVRLSGAGLHLGALREDLTGAAAPGTIARQLPPAGSLTVAGAGVDVWIAAVATVSAPDLTNLTETEALAAAAAADLSVRFLPEVTDEVLPGVVFRQSPGEGEHVAPGSVIVAVLNAAQAPAGDDEGTNETVTSPPPPIFLTLSRSYRFRVLYPTNLPAGLVMLVGPTNPAHHVGQMGAQGFEVAYTDPARPDVRLSLLEGDWFDPGLDRSTTVDVSGYAATLGAAADATVVVWSENGTMYAISAVGLQEQELLSVARGLLPLPPS